MIPPDQYGQQHPTESDALITRKLNELETEIQKIPTNTKVAFVQATETCPELLTDEFKLMFLRSEVFNAGVSSGSCWMLPCLILLISNYH